MLEIGKFFNWHLTNELQKSAFNRMKTDLLAQYTSIREELLKEKAEIEHRLQDINEALMESVSSAPAPSLPQPTSGNGRGRRVNGNSLKSLVYQALANGPLTKEDILVAVQRNGYTFNSKNPANSLGVVLYGSKPKFSRANGKFGLPPGSAGERSSAGGEQSATRGKRVVSSQARARMAAAQKARWAKAGKAQKDNNTQEATPAKDKRQMSPAARKRIAEAAKKRWAAAKAAGKTRL